MSALALGHHVVGIDNLNDYYDVNLKLTSVNLLNSVVFRFANIDLSDNVTIEKLFSDEMFDRIIHLAHRQEYVTR